MTKKESIKFLESYRKNKELEKIKLDSIAEMEINATTAKGIDFGERTAGGKRVLPDYVYSQIVDVKEDLIRSIYSNTIRLKYINVYITKLSEDENNSMYSNILYYKYIKNYSIGQLEKHLNYSFPSIKKYLSEATNLFINEVMKDVDLKLLETTIANESHISREKLDEFYSKYYLSAN